MPPTKIAEFENIAASLSPRITAIAGGDRECDVALYGQLRQKPYIKQCIIVGNDEAMRETSARLGFDIPDEDIIDAKSQEAVAETIFELAKDARIDVIQKGSISTPILNRRLVKLRTRDTMSLATVFEADCIRNGATMIMTDAGVSAILNYDRMVDLINNSAEVARAALNIAEPKVALLAGNEKVIEALPSTVLAQKLANASWDGSKVYGPLSFDLAVDPESVNLKQKTLPDEPSLYKVAGRADVLVHPSLDSANIMYKMLMQMAAAGTARTACVTVGIKTPYIISSRSDPERSRINSVALSCIYSNYLHKKT